MSTITIKQLSFAYPGQKPIFTDCNLDISSDWKLGLLGRNGRGKTSLIKALQGHFASQVTGELQLAHDLTISYVRQHYADNHGSLKEFADEHRLSYEDLLNLLRKLGMDRVTFTVPIEKMSMGQQKKVELAHSLAIPAQIHIWDEPLNYLDTYNQQQLIQVIKNFRPPLLFVEHDRHFIDAVAIQNIAVNPIGAN